MSALPTLVAGRYRLGESLGVGGMGRVWRARDEMLGREVAIKEIVLPVELMSDERDAARLRTLREARAAARLTHPNVVRVYDVIEADGRPWIVMEYVPSRSLLEVVQTDGPLPPRRVAEIGLGVLAALRAAHRVGVQHRDIKPANVLLAEDGRVVLTDFGIATMEGDAAVTRPGLVLGSPAYIAPERARDGVTGPAADLWSLGATLYAAVEGHGPYERPSAVETLTALMSEQPEPPRRAGALAPVLDGLLRKNPADRTDIAETEERLRVAASASAPAASGRRWPWRSARRDRPGPDLPAAAAVALDVPAAAAAAPAGADPAAPAAAAGPAAAAASEVPTQAGPTQAGPTQAAPTQAGPVLAGPTEGAATQGAATQAAATQAAATQGAATQGAATQGATTQAAPTSAAPTPADLAPADPAPTTVATRPAVGVAAVTAPLTSTATPAHPGQEANTGADAIPVVRRPPHRSPAGAEGPTATGRTATGRTATGRTTTGRTTTDGTRTRPTNRPDPRLLLAAALAILVVVGGLALWAVRDHSAGAGTPSARRQPAASAAAASAAAASTSAAPSAGASTASSAPAGADASAGQRVTPSAQPPPVGTDQEAAAQRPALPPGWRDYRDPTGFSLYVPAGWTRSVSGSIVYFRDPGSGRLLGIDQTNQPQPDPVADWRSQASYRVGRGDFPGYREIRIVAVAYWQKAADWEFTYDGRVRQHVNNRGFVVSPTKAYGIYWETSDADWSAALPDLQLILASFRPA